MLIYLLTFTLGTIVITLFFVVPTLLKDYKIRRNSCSKSKKEYGDHTVPTP